MSNGVLSQLGVGIEYADDILANIIRGGQLTAGGVLQAITSYSQEQGRTDWPGANSWSMMSDHLSFRCFRCLSSPVGTLVRHSIAA
jgi:hypothetical protein